MLGGSKKISELTVGYGGLTKYGVKRVRDDAVAVDPVKREVRLASGATLGYDRLIVAPGVDMQYDTLPGLASADAQSKVLHAWKAGPQTVALRRQLEAMRDGGVFAVHIPKAPYRCPPGPYERACQVAHYFKTAKPKSKVLILDANEDVVSKKGLFMAAWNGPYKGIVEYRPNSELEDVDVATLTAKLQFGGVKADVLNVVPPQRAGQIALTTGLITANNRWCGVNWQTMESVKVPGVHVLGDATLSAQLMPKSGHMANQHAKVCAAAVIAMIKNQPLNPAADDGQHLLQLYRRPQRGACRIGPHVRAQRTRRCCPSRAPADSPTRRTSSRARMRCHGRRTSGPTCSRDRPRACVCTMTARQLGCLIGM